MKAPEAAGYAPELTRATSAREFVLNVVNYVLGFLALAAVLVIIYGGVMFVTAGGREEAITNLGIDSGQEINSRRWQREHGGGVEIIDREPPFSIFRAAPKKRLGL